MLLAWLDAHKLGGDIVFRMEDLDPARSRTAFAEAIADDLRWLGLCWDKGYPEAEYTQSRRAALYADAFELLRRQNLLYPCWCSRAERLAASAPHEGENHHDAGCRCARMTQSEQLAMETTGRKPAWKIRAPDIEITVRDAHYGVLTQNLARDRGDFIVRRADGVFSYQFAVSFDDAVMGIGRVVRGHDLLTCAPQQAWLIDLFGGKVPAYAHGPLLVTDGRKLSKRLGDLSTQALRLRFSPEELIGILAHAVGLIDRPEPITAQELVPLFAWDKISRKDIPFPATLLP